MKNRYSLLIECDYMGAWVPVRQFLADNEYKEPSLKLRVTILDDKTNKKIKSRKFNSYKRMLSSKKKSYVYYFDESKIKDIKNLLYNLNLEHREEEAYLNAIKEL